MRKNLKGDDPLLLSTADQSHRGKCIPNTAEKKKNKGGKASGEVIYLLKEPFQFICELTEVSGGDEAKT